MKCLQSTLFLIFLITLTSCKTQEDIRRDKSVENSNEQVSQIQKSSANNSSRFNTLEDQLAKLTGQLEESVHNKQQDVKDIAFLKERLNNLEETNKKQTEYLKILNEKIQEQSAYIEQVIKSLSSISEQKQAPISKKKGVSDDEGDKKEVATIKSGLIYFKEKNYDMAKTTFQEVLNNKKIKNKEKEAATYYLGQIEFKNKNFEEAKVFFSKLFSENPDSTYAAPALLGLAKCFTQLKSREEANQTLDELIARYPKSKEALEAAKIKASK